MKCALACDDMKLSADDTFLLTSDMDFSVVKESAVHKFDKVYRCCIADKLMRIKRISCYIMQRMNQFLQMSNRYIRHRLPRNRERCSGLMIVENIY